MSHQKAAAEIVAVGRQLVSKGLVSGTWGNISARLPETDTFLITPSGVPYENLGPQDLVLLDLEGKVKEGALRPSTETPLHIAIYKKRPDVLGIVHTHSPYASVLAVNRRELPPVLEELAQLLGGTVRVAPYAPPGSRELAEGAVAALEGRSAVILANHGMVGVGRSLKEALLICQVVEKGAQVFLLAQLSGKPHVLSERDVGLLRRNFLEKYGQ
ncbi:MAG: L-fuculose phosphate aldolase FucA, partial [Thermacetogenium phaeum]